MKKYISLLMTVSLLLALAGLSSCAGKTSNVSAAGSFTLSAEPTALSPGDTFTVTLNGAGWENVASFDVLLSASDNLSVVSCKEKDVGELITTVSEVADGVKMGGYVMYTYDIENLDLLTVTYRVSENAKAGDTVKVQADFTQFQVGTDDNGDETVEKKADITVSPLELSID